jgi:dihydroorotate dehydrogenase (NAD+) catalytic subunit
MSKHDLTIDPPLLNAAGSLGFSPDQHSMVEWTRLGAFVTNPVSLEPRSPAHGQRFQAYPGGFLLHTGYPNPGLTQVLRRHVNHWRRSPIPVIVHLLGRNPEEVEKMVRRLEGMEGVMGVEVGVTSEAGLVQVVSFTQAALGELAVIMRLPVERAAELGQAAVQAGASAVSLSPPRGEYPAVNGEITQGRLYGPSVLPLALKAVQELTRLGVPTIGGGGVYSHQDMDAMLAEGAQAVQLDSVLWRYAGTKLFT